MDRLRVQRAPALIRAGVGLAFLHVMTRTEKAGTRDSAFSSSTSSPRRVNPQRKDELVARCIQDAWRRPSDTSAS
jgi:hypothetical protein